MLNEQHGRRLCPVRVDEREKVVSMHKTKGFEGFTGIDENTKTFKTFRIH
jgi:hypothetical protein